MSRNAHQGVAGRSPTRPDDGRAKEVILMGKSVVYELYGKLFRYDFDNCVVEYVHKATEEDMREEAEWLRDHDRPLYGIDADGYMTLDSVGLRLENWEHEGFRREYLSQWCADLDEEAQALASNFEKYELPYMMKQMEETE